MTAKQKYDLRIKSIDLAVKTISGSNVFDESTTAKQVAWFIVDIAKELENELHKALEEKESVLGPCY